MWELDHRKAEHRRIDALELWYWRRLLRIPWTPRRSNQSILKEINPDCSLEGLMMKLKLQSLDFYGKDSLGMCCFNRINEPRRMTLFQKEAQFGKCSVWGDFGWKWKATFMQMQGILHCDDSAKWHRRDIIQLWGQQLTFTAHERI